MNLRTKHLLLLTCLISVLFVSGYARADDAVAPGDFLVEVLKAVQSLGGMPWMGKLAAIITLVLSSMKVSFLNPVWDKLGGFKVYAAPALALILGLFNIHPFTWSAVVAYVAFGGAGAVFFHEIMDSIKEIPGLGSVYVGFINLVQALTGGPAPQKLEAIK